MFAGRFKKKAEEMEPVPLKSLENISIEASSDTQKDYKKLYHESVKRYATLQSGMENYSKLFGKLDKIEQLKGLVLSSLSEKQAQLEQQSQELGRERQEWEWSLHKAGEKQRELEQVCADLRESHRTGHAESIKVCGCLLAQFAVVKAQSRLQQEKITSLETKVSTKRVEVQKLRKSVSKYAHSLQRNRQEFKESLEFSEAERMALAEANTELDLNISALTVQLVQANQQLEETRGLLREKEGLALREKDSKASEASTANSTCSGCGWLRRDLDAALLMLNDQSCAKYGDLLRDNFALTQKVRVAEDELVKGMAEFERLTTYIQDYKTKSKHKVDVLKENLRKAEEEISELDYLIDQVRGVMHQEIDTVKHRPALLKLIRDLDGVEAPNSY